MLALGVCFPQHSSSDGHVFAAPTSRLDYHRPIISVHKDEFNEMPCKLESTENPVSFKNYPTPP